MGGVKSLLQAAANDIEQTTKVKKNTPKKDVNENTNKLESSTPKNLNSKKPKKTGGRPTNAERGIQSRKQYTLTLKEDTYQLILEKAREEDLSFAKFMERAALEYIQNNQ